MSPRRSLAAEADEHVPFARAAEWAGLASPRDRGARDTCPACGEEALKVYPDHAHCYAGCRRFGVTRLLAVSWQLSPDDAAARALESIGYVPAGYAHLWEDSARQPEPDRTALGGALKAWCAAACPDWAEKQYDKPVADRLAYCLGLLGKVHTEEDCVTWLEGCQAAMARLLTPGTGGIS